MQRLFSTFAGGLPGIGLLLQRFLAAFLLVYFAMIKFMGTPFSISMVPQIVCACAGLLLLLGLWTPIVGALVTIVELWILLTSSDPLIPIVLGTLGGTIAMIGPGAWSIDARLFGRKHIET